MRVMVKLRSLGLSLSKSQEIAQEAAPSVIYIALDSHEEKSLTVDADAARSARYPKALADATNSRFAYTLADLPPPSFYHYGLLHQGECELLYTIDDDVVTDDIEASGLINLWASAAAIVAAQPRPLFTLIAPSGFE